MHSHSLSQLECMKFNRHTQQLKTNDQYKLHKNRKQLHKISDFHSQIKMNIKRKIIPEN